MMHSYSYGTEGGVTFLICFCFNDEQGSILMKFGVWFIVESPFGGFCFKGGPALPRYCIPLHMGRREEGNFEFVFASMMSRGPYRGNLGCGLL